MAKISVLMATFNNPPILVERSIKSVMAQTHQDFEIIIKDADLDHPAINHPGIRSLLNELGPKVTYILAPDGKPHGSEGTGYFGHIGFYEAINQMCKTATGDILTIQNADDERGPVDTLAYVSEEFEKHGPSPFFMYGQCEWVDFDNVAIETRTPPDMTFEKLKEAFTLYIPAFFWNKAVHEKFGYYDESLIWAADLDFWLRCWRGMDTMNAPRVIGRYRQWAISQCRENQGTMFAPEADEIRRKHSA